MVIQTWNLKSLNNYEIAILKKNAGIPIDRAEKEAIVVFNKLCANCETDKVAVVFPSVCLDALWRDDEAVYTRSFPNCLRYLLIRNSKETDILWHRINQLLAMRWDDSGILLSTIFRLTKYIKLSSKQKPVFNLLPYDLNNWNSPEMTVQRDWLNVIKNYTV